MYRTYDLSSAKYTDGNSASSNEDEESDDNNHPFMFRNLGEREPAESDSEEFEEDSLGVGLRG